jgi:Holliday junction resolvase
MRLCQSQRRARPWELHMSTATKMVHDEKIASLADSYVQQGFRVITEPAPNQLPFDLGGYKPDLIATKGNTGLIIEVKTKASRVSIDRLQSLAQEVSRHAGWRFLLVTLEDAESYKTPTTADELPTWDQLAAKLQQARDLVGDGALEPAILYLWSIFEAALRKRAIAQNIPVERLPASMLLNHMYSQGEVSVDHLDLFREFMGRRNRLAHGINEPIDQNLVDSILESVSHLLRDWATHGPT